MNSNMLHEKPRAPLEPTLGQNAIAGRLQPDLTHLLLPFPLLLSSMMPVTSGFLPPLCGLFSELVDVLVWLCGNPSKGAGTEHVEEFRQTP